MAQEGADDELSGVAYQRVYSGVVWVFNTVFSMCLYKYFNIFGFDWVV